MQAEDGEAGEVGGGGEEVEVGVDFGSSSDAGLSSSVSSSHEMREFAFDFGSVGAVVGLPVGISLSHTRAGECRFVHGDVDGAATGRVGALVA